MPLSARLHTLRSSSERGDVILGWLTKVVVVLGLAGVCLFDAISVGTTSVSLADDGSYAARQASEAWQSTRDLQRAYDAAAAAAAEQNANNVVATKDFRIDPDNTVHLTIRREAATFVIYRWDRTAKWAQIERPAVGRSVA